MNYKYIFIFVFLIFSLSASAQRWNQRKYELYYGVGVSNFMGDVAAPSDPNKLIWMHFFNTIGATGNVGLKYHLKGRNSIRGSLCFGQLYAEDVADNPNFWYRGYKLSSYFTEVSAIYELEIIKEKRRRTIYRQLGESRFKNLSIPTYLFIGLGVNTNFGKLEQALETITMSESFVNVAPVIPIGIGAKYRINRNTYFNIEASIRIAFSDGIDHARKIPEGQEPANIGESTGFGDYFDQYQFLTFNIIHKLKSNRKGLPKFKKR